MKHVPNFITCLNLFSGCLACVMALEGLYFGAFVFIIIASVFDFLDGFAARLLKAYSNIGKELDSLADVVSFGLAPGMMIFHFLRMSTAGSFFEEGLPFIAFLIPVFSALRLAKFNVDTRQSESFIGLPVPADALFWSALILVLSERLYGNELLCTVVAACLIIPFCLLMVSEIPMFSLKFKHYRWQGNEIRFILIIVSLFLIYLLHYFGVCLTIVTYIMMSIFQKPTSR